MIKLALPGLVMVLAEYLAFEVLTLASSYFSVTHLAAQSVLTTITALTFQIPFSISIAASTRVANLIGATLSDAAKTSSKVVCILPPNPKFSDLCPATLQSIRAHLLLGYLWCLYSWPIQLHTHFLSPQHCPTPLHRRHRRYKHCR